MGEPQVLAPRVEAAAAAVGALDHGAQPAVAAREHALEQAGLGVAVLERDRPALHRVAQQPQPAVELRRAHLRGPRERRVGLGDVRRHADRDAEALVAGVASGLPRAVAQLEDGAEIVVRLGGQSAHEVELGARVALARRRGHGGHELGLRVVLVDHVAHALAAGLGRQGDGSGSAAHQGIDQERADTVDAQRRQ